MVMCVHRRRRLRSARPHTHAHVSPAHSRHILSPQTPLQTHRHTQTLHNNKTRKVRLRCRKRRGAVHKHRFYKYIMGGRMRTCGYNIWTRACRTSHRICVLFVCVTVCVYVCLRYIGWFWDGYGWVERGWWFRICLFLIRIRREKYMRDCEYHTNSHTYRTNTHTIIIIIAAFVRT